MIDINILLLNAQETNVGIVWYIIKRNACHQPAEERQHQQYYDVQYVCATKNLN